MSEPSRRPPVFYLALGVMLGVLATVGVFVALEISRPGPAPTPAPPPALAAETPGPQPTPSPEASPSPEPPSEEAEASPSPEAPPATPRPTPGQARLPTPRPEARATAAPPLAKLVEEAEAAAARHDYAGAVKRFDEALASDPQNARAKAGRASAQAAAALARGFVPEASSAAGPEQVAGKLRGFDAESVDVRKAARVPARIEFDADPAHVKPGEVYSVRVYLLNTGKKAIEIKGLNITRTQDGQIASNASPPQTREVRPKQRALLGTHSGIWAADTTSWSLEVVVLAERGDTYRGQLAWK